jgi:hypothetical protein
MRFVYLSCLHCDDLYWGAMQFYSFLGALAHSGSGQRLPSLHSRLLSSTKVRTSLGGPSGPFTVHFYVLVSPTFVLDVLVHKSLQCDCRHTQPGPLLRRPSRVQRVLEEEVRQLEEDRRLLGTEIIPSGDKTWPLPCNLKRMIWNAQKLFVQPKNEPSKLEVLAIKAGVDRLLKQLMVRDARLFVTASGITVQGNVLFHYPHAPIGGKIPSYKVSIYRPNF